MIKKTFRVISAVLFAVLFLVTTFFVVLKFMGGNQTMFGYNIYYVVTGSMEPKYSTGDILLGKSVDTEQLVVGDVVTYLGADGQISGKMITHQIVEIQENQGTRQFITKGLANAVADPPVAPQQIQSKILFKIPLLGKIFALANHKWGFFVLFVLPLICLLVNEVVSLVQVCKKEKEEQNNEADHSSDENVNASCD